MTQQGEQRPPSEHELRETLLSLRASKEQPATAAQDSSTAVPSALPPAAQPPRRQSLGRRVVHLPGFSAAPGATPSSANAPEPTPAVEAHLEDGASPELSGAAVAPTVGSVQHPGSEASEQAAAQDLDAENAATQNDLAGTAHDDAATTTAIESAEPQRGQPVAPQSEPSSEADSTNQLVKSDAPVLAVVKPSTTTHEQALPSQPAARSDAPRSENAPEVVPSPQEQVLPLHSPDRSDAMRLEDGQPEAPPSPAYLAARGDATHPEDAPEAPSASRGQARLVAQQIAAPVDDTAAPPRADPLSKSVLDTSEAITASRTQARQPAPPEHAARTEYDNQFSTDASALRTNAHRPQAWREVIPQIAGLPSGAQPETSRESVRRFLRPLIGIDPASVPTYRGAAAQLAAASYQAAALALDGSIVLADDAETTTPRGLALLAHELTHIARQRQPRFVPPALRRDQREQPEGSEEQLAEAVERQVAALARVGGEARSSLLGTPTSDALPAAPGAAWAAPFGHTSVEPAGNASPVAAPPDKALWGGLPAPWEPLPSSLAATREPAAPAASAQRAGPSDEAVPRLAGLARATPPPPPVASHTSAPTPARSTDPDLDTLARQVYAALKQRLAAERRRMSS